MKECPNLPNCGFVKKYHDSKSLAVKGFIVLYCKSDKQSECKRKEYKAQTGQAPPDDMLPGGGTMK